MRRIESRMLPAVGLWLLSTAGCATMIHEPITSPAEDAKDRGVRYYGTSPYLIAYSNAKGGVVTELRYLPDPAKKFSVRPDTKLADVKSALQFENGALTSSADTGDATAVTKAVQTAVEKLGTALIAAGNVARGAQPTDMFMPAPTVYRVVVTDNVVELIGGNPAKPFRVTLLPQPPPKKKEGEK